MNTKISGEEALKKTTEILRKMYPAAKNSDATMGSLLVAFPNGFIPDFTIEGELKSISLSPEDPQHVYKLLDTAESLQEAYDALVVWAAAQLLCKKYIPNGDAQRFIASHLLDSSKRPKKSGRPSIPAKHRYRHSVICYAVSNLEREGFSPILNDAGKHSKIVCDIVADAMIELKFLPQSSGEIKKILDSGDRVGFSR